MRGTSLTFDLILLNLWIGMCRGVAGLPRNLRLLGYKDTWIEKKFPNQDLEPVCPDLVVASEKVKNTLLLEWKSGANTESDQLRRYSRVTQSDLETRAFIARDASHSHDVVIIGRSEYGDRLRIGIEHGHFPFPLLLVAMDGIGLSYNAFKVPQLNALFSPKLELDLRRVPSRFVPLDASSDLWEVAEVVMPKVLQYMTERRSRVDIAVVCQDICDTWSIMGQPARQAVTEKLVEAIRQASRMHFKKYIRLAANRGSFEIINNPLDLTSSKRTAVYKKLLSAQKSLLQAMRTGQGDGSEQLELFREPTN